MRLFPGDNARRRKLHIILADDEGPVRSLVITKTDLCLAVNGVLAGFITLLILSVAGMGFFLQSTGLQWKVAGLAKQLHAVCSANRTLEQQVVQLRAEKEELLSEAVDKLNEKSRLIESILSSVGVEVKEEDSRRNTGGPFTRFTDEPREDLIVKADRYLEAIRTIPLGLPVTGVVTSKFGRRIDPFNSQIAFHLGIDIRGKIGTEVKATADGTVFQVGVDAGYGRFVILDHGNDFRTIFAHLKKILVKNNEKISKGQPVGLLGNSGRSTGPHVHYEIRFEGKAVNPAKYIRIARYTPSEKHGSLTTDE